MGISASNRNSRRDDDRDDIQTRSVVLADDKDDIQSKSMVPDDDIQTRSVVSDEKNVEVKTRVPQGSLVFWLCVWFSCCCFFSMSNV